MILQALYGLAQKEGHTEDLDFEPKRIPWIVKVDLCGNMIGIVGTHYSPPQKGTKKQKPVAMFRMMPREGDRTSGDRAFFLYDKAEYVFGIVPEKAKKKSKPQKEKKSRFDLFREKTEQCLKATGDDGVAAIWAFLEKGANREEVHELMLKYPEYTDSDLFAFVFAPDIDQLVSDRKKVRDYWKALRKTSDKGSKGHCLVTNTPAIIGGLFPSVKKVPGGTTSGVSLVSINTDAFESYGWAGNLNAPISRNAAEACATVLERLLEDDYPDPRNIEQTLPPRNVRISADTVVCYWTPEVNAEDFCSVFSGLLNADPGIVKELYLSIWYGKAPHIENTSAFYALTLTGTQGRAIVRDWFESTVAVVANNLAAHFADLNIVQNAPTNKIREIPLPLKVLFESIAEPTENRNKGIPAPLSVKIVSAALSGMLYPLSAMQRAILRYRVEIGQEKVNAKIDWKTVERNNARAALIKAVLNRRQRLYPQTSSYKEVQPDMDPNYASEGYVLGKLMAVLERIQQEAVDANATVVDRYFSGASASPKSVFVRLLKNAKHHVRKAKEEKGKGGHVFLLDRLIDELSSQFDPKNNGFPSFLSLDQQGLFVLGYHQMRKWLWMPKEERTAWEASHPDAPSQYFWSKNNPETGVEIPLTMKGQNHETN